MSQARSSTWSLLHVSEAVSSYVLRSVYQIFHMLMPVCFSEQRAAWIWSCSSHPSSCTTQSKCAAAGHSYSMLWMNSTFDYFEKNRKSFRESMMWPVINKKYSLVFCFLFVIIFIITADWDYWSWQIKNKKQCIECIPDWVSVSFNVKVKPFLSRSECSVVMEAERPCFCSAVMTRGFTCTRRLDQTPDQLVWMWMSWQLHSFLRVIVL